MEKILVTGANGYIGSRLIFYLNKKDICPIALIREEAEWPFSLDAEIRRGDFSDEKFTEEINNNVGVYPGNMVNNKCKYDLKLYSHYIGLSCFTSIDYDLINIFLPFMGRRETSLLTIYPSEFATIYYSRDSNIPFNKFIDEKNLSKGYTEAFEQFALTSLETGNCIGSN